MKLTKLKRVVLSLLLLNSLVACKAEIELEQLSSEQEVISQNLKEVDRHSAIIDHNYDIKNHAVNLTVSTAHYQGELMGELDITGCAESYPAVCYAELHTYSLEPERSGLEFAAPAIQIETELSIDLDLTEEIGTLVITDDNGQNIKIDLQAKTAECIHEQLIIESILVNAEFIKK